MVRGIGLLSSTADIGAIVVTDLNDTPVLVRDIGQSGRTHAPRVGQAGLDAQDDVVEGIVIMRKGENPAEVLGRVKDKIELKHEGVA